MTLELLAKAKVAALRSTTAPVMRLLLARRGQGGVMLRGRRGSAKVQGIEDGVRDRLAGEAQSPPAGRLPQKRVPEGQRRQRQRRRPRRRCAKKQKQS